jgi:hypothetical protein
VVVVVVVVVVAAAAVVVMVVVVAVVVLNWEESLCKYVRCVVSDLHLCVDHSVCSTRRRGVFIIIAGVVTNT